MLRRPTITVRRVVILKVTIAVGLVVPHFLPPYVAVFVSSGANLLWLFSD